MAYARRRADKCGNNWAWSTCRWVVGIAGLLCMAYISARMIQIEMNSAGPLESQRLDDPVLPWRRIPQALGESHQLADKTLASGKAAPSQAQAAAAVTGRSAAAREPPSLPATEVVDLSLGRPAASDVHGNLGPPELVTAAGESKDWLKDRWQAATGMSGVPIPGEHWLRVDLADAESLLERIVLDFEVAHAKIYLLETSQSASGPWRRLTEVRTCCSEHLTVRASGHHVVHTIRRPAKEEWKADRFVRARFTHLATMWGVSVYRFRLLGRALSNAVSPRASAN